MDLEVRGKRMSGSDVFDPVSELDDLVGLTSVKQRLQRMLAEHKALKEVAGERKPPNPHLLLIGRSGVGKGAVTQSFGNIFRARGLVRRGHLTYADRASLIAGYVGQTAVKTKAVCEEALEGVLYIDDAHMLAGGFGQEAIDTLLAFMQAHGDRIVIVMDSWPGKIVEFTAACPRLMNQFNPIEFPLYNADELIGILRAMATRIKYTVPDEIETMLRPWLEQRMNHAISRGAFWRSAWEVRSLLIRTAGKQAARTGTKNHFDHPQASRAHMRELDIEFEMAPLELADFQAVMADIGET
jgi:stage V sporulation protein K